MKKFSKDSSNKGLIWGNNSGKQDNKNIKNKNTINNTTTTTTNNNNNNKISTSDKKKAIELLNNGLKQKKKIDKIKYILKSLDINPSFLDAFYNLGIIYFECAEKLIKDNIAANNNDIVDYIKKGLEYLYKVIQLDTSNRGDITGFSHIALANSFIDYRNIIMNSTELMEIIKIDNRNTLYEKSLFHNNQSIRILQNDIELDTYIFNYGELLVNLFDDYIDSIELKLKSEEENNCNYNDIILQSSLLLTSVLNTYDTAIQTPYSSDIDTDILISKTEILIKYWDFQVDLYKNFEKYNNNNNNNNNNYVYQHHEEILIITRLLIISIIKLAGTDDYEMLNLASDMNDSLLIWLSCKNKFLNSFFEIGNTIKTIDGNIVNNKEVMQVTCEVLLKSRLDSILIFEKNHYKMNKNLSNTSKILDNFKNLVQSYANLGDSLRIISISINVPQYQTNIDDIIISLIDVVLSNNKEILNNDQVDKKDNSIIKLLKEINVIIFKNITDDQIIRIDDNNNNDIFPLEINNQFILSLAENCYNKSINIIVNTELRNSLFNEFNEIMLNKNILIVNKEEKDDDDNEDDDDDGEDDTIFQTVIDIVYNRACSYSLSSNIIQCCNSINSYISLSLFKQGLSNICNSFTDVINLLENNVNNSINKQVNVNINENKLLDYNRELLKLYVEICNDEDFNIIKENEIFNNNINLNSQY